jgi:hypothetical protein
MIKQISIFAGAIALSCALSVAAQPYPSKPLRLIVPYPPGGTGDALCREMAARMSTVGAEGAPNTPAQFAAFFRAEMDKNGRLIRELGLKAE